MTALAYPARSAGADKAHFAFFASPEDVILKKMQYYLEGGSEKHIRDISGILKLSGDRINAQYVAEWAKQLGLTDIWETVLRKLAPSTSAGDPKPPS